MIVQNKEMQCGIQDEMKEKFRQGSASNREYINAFYEHSDELVKIFCMKPEILIMWDDLMNEFNTNELSTGKVSKESADKMKAILDEVYQLSSDKLRMAIEKHKAEIDYFPDTMAFLQFSFYFF